MTGKSANPNSIEFIVPLWDCTLYSHCVVCTTELSCREYMHSNDGDEQM